ncbi:MAG: helix-turn-helix transcriptional regulator [Candidatus Thiodiazotropha weberae]|nr:helix-turn-helix transcriptional regulator [Candidatus Thiodiazotropha weberae]
MIRKTIGQGESSAITRTSTSQSISGLGATPETKSEVIFLDFSPDGLPQPEGFVSIEDHISERERDPERKAALALARREIAAELYPDDHSISAMRLQKGWSQQHLAEVMGTSQPQVARIESGRLDPQLSTIKKLVGAFNSDIDTICRALENIK